MREHFSIVLCYSDGRKLQHIIAILARLNKNCVKRTSISVLAQNIVFQPLLLTHVYFQEL